MGSGGQTRCSGWNGWIDRGWKWWTDTVIRVEWVDRHGDQRGVGVDRYGDQGGMGGQTRLSGVEWVHRHGDQRGVGVDRHGNQSGVDNWFLMPSRP